jgi:hypothetical protein
MTNKTRKIALFAVPVILLITIIGSYAGYTYWYLPREEDKTLGELTSQYEQLVKQVDTLEKVITEDPNKEYTSINTIETDLKYLEIIENNITRINAPIGENMTGHDDLKASMQEYTDNVYKLIDDYEKHLEFYHTLYTAQRDVLAIHVIDLYNGRSLIDFSGAGQELIMVEEKLNATSPANEKQERELKKVLSIASAYREYMVKREEIVKNHEGAEDELMGEIWQIQLSTDQRINTVFFEFIPDVGYNLHTDYNSEDQFTTLHDQENAIQTYLDEHKGE